MVAFAVAGQWRIDPDMPANAGSIPPSPETSGTLSLASAGLMVEMDGNATIPADVFSRGMCIAFWNRSGGSATLSQGAGMSLILAGGTAGNRTLAANAMGVIWFSSGTEAGIKGTGVT